METRRRPSGLWEPKERLCSFIRGGAQCGPSLLRPGDINASDLTAWFDLSDEATVTTSAGNITGVTDKAGLVAGRDLSDVQTTGDLPEYLSAANGINGRRAGKTTTLGDEGLQTPSNSTHSLYETLNPDGADGYTIFLIFDLLSTSDGNIWTANGGGIALNISSGNIRFAIDDWTTTTSVTTTATTGIHSVFCHYDGGAAGTMRLVVDGSESTATGQDDPANGWPVHWMGFAHNSFPDSAELEYGEIATWRSKLSTAEEANLHNGAKMYWGAP